MRTDPLGYFPPWQRVSIRRVVAQAIELATPLMEERAQRVCVEVEPGFPVRVDEGRLTQVLANLLTNASKYSHPNTEIVIRAERRGDRVAISVRDRGPGIAPEDLDEPAFASFLDTHGIPEPDLVVRTAGEMRLSNFLIWQAAYAEYYTTPVYWPDFDEHQIELALDAYAARGRRFGGLVEVDSAAAHNGHTNGVHKNGAKTTNGARANGVQSASV